MLLPIAVEAAGAGYVGLEWCAKGEEASADVHLALGLPGSRPRKGCRSMGKPAENQSGEMET